MSIVGIDLGTLNTVIAVRRSGGVDVICNEVSDRATPTMVSFDSRRRYIGDTARTQQVGNFRNTVSQIPRLVGVSREQEDIEAIFQTCEFTEKNEMLAIKVNYQNEERIFSSTEVLAMFLGKVKQIVQNETRSNAIDCVMAVPLYFKDAQRRAVLEAAEIAGLNCLRIINDTSASAICYGLTKNDQLTETARNVCIVDIGYSGIKAAVVSFTKGGLSVKATSSDSSLGGRDFDMVLVDHFASEIQKKNMFDIRSSKKAFLRLRIACERIKKILTGNAFTRMDLEALHEGRDFGLEMKRKDFESLCLPLLERLEKCLLRLIERAKLPLAEYDSVEIVGGASRIPVVRELLERVFGHEVRTTLNQEEAIACGAALQCAIESPSVRVKSFSTKDICSHGYTFYDQELFPEGSDSPSSKTIALQASLPFEAKVVYTDSSLLAMSCVISSSSLSSGMLKMEWIIDNNNLLSLKKAVLVEEIVENEATSNRKVITREYELKISSFIPLSFDRKTLDVLRNQELVMVMADKHAAELDDCKNAVEAYIYEMRGKLGGELSRFTQEAEAESFLRVLNQSESWLYEQEGVDKKEVFVNKLAELKKVGQPIMDRYLELQDRPAAESAIRQTVASIVEKAHSIQEEFRAPLIQECNAKIQWIESLLEIQSNLKPYEKPAFFVSDIYSEREKLVKHATTIFSQANSKKEQQEKEEREKEQKLQKEKEKENDIGAAPNMDVD